MMNTQNFKNIDEYIALQPKEVKPLLKQLRQIIKKAAPKTTEVISYCMPAFKQYGVLVYFAGWKNHVGFYPTSLPIKAFADELKDYKTAKGVIQFPLDKQLPADLITKIVKYRLKEDLDKQMIKEMTKSKRKKINIK